MLLHPCYHALHRPEQPAYIMAFSGEVVTYKQLDSRSNQGAHLFRNLDVKRGDHIAIMMENNARFFEIVWSAQRAGLYYTPISYSLKSNEIEYILNDCNAKVLITSVNQLNKIQPILGKLNSLIACYTVECIEGNKSSVRNSKQSALDLDQAPLENTLKYGLKRIHSWEQSIATFPMGPISDQSEGREMLYSSGTTGQPKGIKVPLADGEIGQTKDVLLAAEYAKFLGTTQNTVFLSTSPLYHSAPFGYNMNNFRIGATSIIMEKFDAEESLRLIEKYQISLSQWVPTMFTRLLKLPSDVRRKYDVSSLKCAIHGAAPCAISVKEGMIDWWGPILIEFYSGSEKNGIFMITSEEWLAHKGSVGRCMDAKVHIVDDRTGQNVEQEMPIGQVGTVYCESNNKFEYHNAPDKTASSRNHMGWTTIGDLGYVDSEGYLYLTDRKDYMIISGGVNVYPQEVEDTLISHPKIYDLAVFGIPDEDLGEKVHAVIQLADKNEASKDMEKMLIAYCKERLSSIKCPKSIHFAAELPREDTGKLKKRLIKNLYWRDGITMSELSKELGLMSEENNPSDSNVAHSELKQASVKVDLSRLPTESQEQAYTDEGETASSNSSSINKTVKAKRKINAIHEKDEKLMKGPQVILNLHNEHKYMSKLLDVVSEQLDALQQGLTPDYSIMSDVVFYLENISDRSHHPREDIIYKRLVEVDESYRTDIESLFIGHETIAQKTTVLLQSLKKVIADESVENIESVKFHCEDYLSTLHGHMDVEERKIFPRVLELFNEEEWTDIISDIQPNNDPLFGKKVEHRYQNLYDYLSNRVEDAAEDFTLAQFIGLTAFTEIVGTVSKTASTIKDLVAEKARKEMKNDTAAYKRLWKARNRKVKDYFNLSIDCMLNGFDTYAECVTEVSVILRRSRDQISEPYSSRIKLYQEMMQDHDVQADMTEESGVSAEKTN